MMERLKAGLTNFPTHAASSATAVLLVLLTGLIVVERIARGQPFPDGYGDWLVFLGATLGINTAGLIGKRLTNIDYKAASIMPAPQVHVDQATEVRTEGESHAG